MRRLAAFGLVAGLCAPALAHPDHDRPPPPSMMRQEVQMRLPVDGRADTQSFVRDAKPEPWQRAERPAERAPTGAQRMDLPLKSDVQQKLRPGDTRDTTPKPQALQARPVDAKPAGDRMGRPEAKPALPIKIDVAMKLSGGDDREPSAAKPAAHEAGARAAAMNPHDKQMLCKMAGVCLPQGKSSDDVEDLAK